MKQCPQCKQAYIDDSLNYCLVDGAGLIQPNIDDEEQTVLHSAPETVFEPNFVRRGVNPLYAYLAIPVLALLVGAGLVVWLKSSDDPPAAANDPGVVENARPNVDENPPVSVPIPPAAPAPKEINAPASKDVNETKSEVAGALNNWLQTVKSKDLGTRMSYYSARLDTYYTQKNVSISAVRAENQRALDEYSDLDMSISNVSTSVDPSTNKATTTFDKTFNFRGGDHIFEGAVRSEFRWSKISGKWKITSERDLKVYRINKD